MTLDQIYKAMLLNGAVVTKGKSPPTFSYFSSNDYKTSAQIAYNSSHENQEEEDCSSTWCTWEDLIFDFEEEEEEPVPVPVQDEKAATVVMHSLWKDK